MNPWCRLQALCLLSPSLLLLLGHLLLLGLAVGLPVEAVEEDEEHCGVGEDDLGDDPWVVAVKVQWLQGVQKHKHKLQGKERVFNSLWNTWQNSWIRNEQFLTLQNTFSNNKSFQAEGR